MTSTLSKTRRIRLCAMSLLAAMALAAPTTASAQLAPLYNQLMDTIQQQVMNMVMAKMGVGVEGAVGQSGAATQAQVLQGATASKAVQEGVAAYQTQEALRRQAQDSADAMKQPADTCATMAVQSGLGNASATTSARVIASHAKVMKSISGTANTMQAAEVAHRTTNETMCTPAEAARGICKVNQSNIEYAGADQSAAFLFESKDGSPTYAGGQSGPQAKAAESYINRVVSGLPEAQLRGANYDKNPQNRSFVELMRRYASVLSMVSYSLNQIKEARSPQQNLGVDTQLSNAPGFAQGKADMSMLEAVQRFVSTKFSPEAIADSAKATNGNLILRDMAQTNAFQLWIQEQTMMSDERTEALMAHQLALLTEQTLRPALEAQRQAAARAAATSAH